MRLIDRGAELPNYVHYYAKPYLNLDEMSAAGKESTENGKDSLLEGLAVMGVGLTLYESGKSSELRPLTHIGKLAALGSMAILLKGAAKLYRGSFVKNSVKTIELSIDRDTVTVIPGTHRIFRNYDI